MMQRRKETIAELDPDRDYDLDRKLLNYQRAIDDMTAELQFILEQEEEFVDGYCGHEDCDRYEQAEDNTIQSFCRACPAVGLELLMSVSLSLVHDLRRENENLHVVYQALIEEIENA